MLFILILASFGLVVLIALDGDYQSKEIEKQKQQWYDLFNEKYK